LREPEIAASLAADAKTVISAGAFVDDIVSLAVRLEQAMRERGRPWRTVIGIARGGVFPALRVAEALGLEYREVQISYYRGTVKSPAPEILTELVDERQGDGWLVVDDVIDSGGTALCVRQALPRCDLAAVYTKPAGLAALSSTGAVPFCGREMGDKWIVFPWDQPGWDELAPQLVVAFREKTGRRPF
jgi:xanthine phosphoribosyltransferase